VNAQLTRDYAAYWDERPGDHGGDGLFNDGPRMAASHLARGVTSELLEGSKADAESLMLAQRREVARGIVAAAGGRMDRAERMRTQHNRKQFSTLHVQSNDLEWATRGLPDPAAVDATKALVRAVNRGVRRRNKRQKVTSPIAA
jgi:hypothetical protein